MTASGGAPGSRDGASEAFDARVEMLRADPRLTSDRVERPHPWLAAVWREDRVVLVAPAIAWDEAREVFAPFASERAEARASLVLLGVPASPGLDEALERGLSCCLSPQASADELYVAIHNGFELVGARQRAVKSGVSVDRYRYEIGELFAIAQAITTERDIDKLLALILEKGRFISGADAGSIYVVEGDEPDLSRRRLHFKLSQNDSVRFDASEFTIPINERSMAGYAALHRTPINLADVYNLEPDTPFGFDRSFDEKIGYRTKSVLTTPLRSRRGEVIGVLQLINRKRDARAKLTEFVELAGVIPFDDRSVALLSTLGSLAGIALENAMLYVEQEQMLEGFVRASVEAIEQRDPTTSGHSIRVADMTVALAGAVERIDVGAYRDVSFTRDDIQELEYASLLHDFGKIGVREQVLVKAKKLYPHDLEIIRHRFALAARELEVAALHRKIEAMDRGAGSADLAAIDEDLARRRAQLRTYLETIDIANEPKVLSGDAPAMIEEIARKTYVDAEGATHPLLTAGEVESLSVLRGSLTAVEYDEIRSHVTHTYEFLRTIPWGRKFRRIADIAGAHHERLDGTGYPNRLDTHTIPLQAKMMSVSDIFDALTAADRPYKRAVPLARACDILHMEVRENHIDGELVRVFIESKAWETLADPPRD
ncbi:MAG: HD domain-containing phosphohydrolase [Myxococcota bacterium]